MMLSVLLMIFGLHAHATQADDVGGDSIYCNYDAWNMRKFPSSGFYTLDYVAYVPEHVPNGKVESLKVSLDRIEALIRKYAPEKLASFLSFRVSVDPVFPNNTLERAWFPHRQSIQMISAPMYVGQDIPKNCAFIGSGPKDFYHLYQQTVTRIVQGNQIVYAYDPEVMTSYFSQADATQISMILIHEWLWDFFFPKFPEGGAQKVREANVFLHSSMAENSGSKTFRGRVFGEYKD